MPYIQLQFRRDTSTNWTSTNPLLASGEMGIELDTHTFKIGDGTSRWNNLPYGGLQGPAGPAGLIPPSASAPGQVLTYIGPNPSNISWQTPTSSTGNRAIIKATKASTNFNFQDATLTLPACFGSGYQPINGTSDTNGFSILLNSNFTMATIPSMLGTVSYWDGTKMTYMQIKFGNSSTSNAVRATVTPTNSLSSVNINGLPTYGAPLLLTVDGISSSSFIGVTNISSGIAPLNYAIIVYLQIVN